MELRHCGQDKRIFFCPVHSASSPCSLQAFGIRCIVCDLASALVLIYKKFKNSFTTTFKLFCFVIVPSEHTVTHLILSNKLMLLSSFSYFESIDKIGKINKVNIIID